MIKDDVLAKIHRDLEYHPGDAPWSCLDCYHGRPCREREILLAARDLISAEGLSDERKGVVQIESSNRSVEAPIVEKLPEAGSFYPPAALQCTCSQIGPEDHCAVHGTVEERWLSNLRKHSQDMDVAELKFFADLFKEQRDQLLSAVEAFIAAWESFPEGYYKADEIQDWIYRLKPAADKARVVRASLTMRAM